MKRNNGTITPALLIITGAFVVIIYSLLLLLALQLDGVQRQTAREQSLAIAEAGVEYYRWHLSHDPDDIQDGTGASGPYVHEYLDPQGDRIGQFSLNITASPGSNYIVTVESTGSTDRYPNVARTVVAQFGKPALSRHAFLNNGSIWYGPGVVVNGDVHSNNGIRMDGINTGKVTSAKDEYMCGSETGCHPPTKKPGVWGVGQDQALWEFPVPAVDFDSIAADFVTMKSVAQSSGLYLDKSNAKGYHIIFNSDGTFDVTRVTLNQIYLGYSVPGEGLGVNGTGGCRDRELAIQTEEAVGTYNQSDASVIFVEDDVWLEGTITSNLTVAAAGFPLTSRNNNVILPNNLMYDPNNDDVVLGVIAQNDIYITRDVPNDMILDGAYMAQKGRIMRHGYFSGCGQSSTSIRNSININGAMITYGKSYWNYGDPLESGFLNRIINYDSNLFYNAPPYYPTSGEFELLNWSEK